MIDPDSLAALRRTFAAALDHDDPVKARRELLDSGWLEALDEDEPACAAVLFRLQGAACRDAAALDDILMRNLVHRWPGAAADVAVAYPLAAGPAPAGGARHVVLPAHRHAGRLLWLDDLAGHLEMIELDAQLDGPVLGGVDPDFGLIQLPERPAGRARRPEEIRSPWDGALAAGRVALSHQLVTGAKALLDRAVVYSQARRQFGTPIGAFQAVKHRLAETLVAVSAADAAAVAATTSRDPTAAAVAKALAGRAAATAARHCLQVFGGVGFTMEHEFHRYFRRNLVLDRLLGDADTLERDLGRRLRTGELGRGRVVELDLDARLGTLVGP